MNTPDSLDRLTLLEHAQLRHDATLRRHDAPIAPPRGLQEQQTQLLATLTDVSARLETTLQAIKDLLDRGNGHEEAA